MTLSAGQRVVHKFIPSKLGYIIDNPRERDPKYKTVAWDGGQKERIRATSLKLVELDLNIPAILLESNLFAGVEDLRLALTSQRLSGRIDNLIYSLNLTNTDFYPYQFKPVLSFLRSRTQSLLIADEVGLGKTIEAGLIWVELQMREKANRLLVVCPSVLCDKWKMELATKFNTKAEIINATDLLEKIEDIKRGRITQQSYIVSIQSARPRKNWGRGTANDPGSKLARYLRAHPDYTNIFDLLILDEAHIIRNRETASYDFIELIKSCCNHLVFLSATPIQTSNADLFTLVNIISPLFFPTEESLSKSIEESEPLVSLTAKLSKGAVKQEFFIQKIKEAMERSNSSTWSELNEWLAEPPSQEMLDSARERSWLIVEIHKLIPLFQVMSRTLKSEVLEDRVTREPNVIKVIPTMAEKALYEEVSGAIRKYCIENEIPYGFALVMPQRLISSSPQAACLHWEDVIKNEMEDTSSDEFLQEITESEEEEDNKNRRVKIFSVVQDVLKNFYYKKELQEKDSKFEALLEFLRDYRKKQPGKKVILFSFFKKTLERLATQLNDNNIRAVVYTGSIDQKDRSAIIEKFKKDDSMILLSSEIASEGIDLQFMDCLINYDLPWNPAKVEQRIGRLDRIGQKSPKVFVVNFVHKGTVDDVIYLRLMERIGLFKKALGLAEDILGKEISKLSEEMFLSELTPEQIEEKINQAATAIENIKNYESDLRKGNSIVFNIIQQEILEAQKMRRFVTADDLEGYIKSYFQKSGEGSHIWQINREKALVRIQLSPKTYLSFRDFLMNMPNAGTQLGSNNDCEVQLKEKVSNDLSGVEQITQSHPLITYIAASMKKDQIEPTKLSAVTLYRNRLPEEYRSQVKSSIYFYWISSWTTEGKRRDSSVLDYFVMDLTKRTKLDDDSAEMLINTASTEGSDWLVSNVFNRYRKEELMDALNFAQDRVNEKFSQYQKVAGTSHDNEVSFEIRQQEFQKQVEEEDFEKRLNSLLEIRDSAGRKGLETIFRNRHKEIMERLNLTLENIKREAEKFRVDQSDVSVGIIEVIEDER